MCKSHCRPTSRHKRNNLAQRLYAYLLLLASSAPRLAAAQRTRLRAPVLDVPAAAGDAADTAAVVVGAGGSSGLADAAAWLLPELLLTRRAPPAAAAAVETAPLDAAAGLAVGRARCRVFLAGRHGCGCGRDRVSLAAAASIHKGKCGVV